MTLLRTSLLSAVAVFVKVLSMLATNKILAIYVGPQGYALIGQFQNAMTALTAVASAGVGTGVTKFTAEYNEDPQRQRTVWSTAAITGLAGASVVAILLLIFNRPLSVILLKDEQHASTLLWGAACLPLFVLNALLLAVLNGKKAVKNFVVANIANSIASLLLVGVCAWSLGLQGALIALAAGQSASCLVTLWLCTRESWFRFSDLWSRFDRKVLAGLSHFTLMSAATSLLGPLSQVLARDQIIEEFGAAAAGHWEAIMRISSVYLMFVTTPLSVYYLPRLAELTDKAALRREIAGGYRLLLPVAALSALVIFLLRDIVIAVLFTAEFRPMRDLFAWQMVGDVFRIAAWLLSFYLLGKALTRAFLVVEVVFNFSFVALVWWAGHHAGTAGAPMAYAINNALYLSALAWIVRRDLSR